MLDRPDGEPVAGPDDTDFDDTDFDDIEAELCMSSREASMSFIPSAALDLRAATSALAGRTPRHLRAVR